jgi:hypothetical protein
MESLRQAAVAYFKQANVPVDTWKSIES